MTPSQINLSKFLTTKSQAREFSVSLASVIQHIFETNFQLDAALNEALGLQKKDAFLTLMHEHAVNIQKPTAVKDFLSLIQQQLNTMPVLTVTLACEPKEQTLKLLSDWFLQNINRQVLLDISVDASLVGGLVIHYNGRFLDYTIRQAFLTILQQTMNPEQASTVTPPTQDSLQNQVPPPVQSQPIQPVVQQPAVAAQ